MNALTANRRIEFVVAGVIFAAATVLFLPPQLVVGLAIASLMLAAGLIRPALGLGLIAVTIPVQEAVTIAIGPGSMTLTRLALLPFLAGWGIRWLNRDAAIRLTPPIVAWFLLLAALVVSFPAAIDRVAWAEEVYRWSAAFALYVVAADVMKRAEDCVPLIIGSASGIILASLAGLWQIATAAGPASFQANGLTRVYAFFGEPNPFAAYLEMTLPLLIAISLPWVITRRPGLFDRTGTLLLASIAAVGSLMLLLTQSRGGYLGFGAALVAIGLLSGPRSRLLTLAGLLVIALLVTLTPPGRHAAQRFTSSVAVFNSREEVTVENWSVQERVAHWRAGLQMLRDNPWTGVGAGNFNQRYREYTQVWRFRIPRGHAHNNEIQMGAQGGYTGLIAYLALLFTVGVRILRGVRRTTQASARALAIGAFGVFIAVLVHGQFDYLHGLSLSLAFALALACAEPAATTPVAARERLTAS